MFTNLDVELYPNDCEVVEMPLHDQWVYLIQKNASSSLKNHMIEYGFRRFKNDEIRKLQTIDVYIRNPRERYVSGVKTFVDHIIAQNDTLDYDTCVYMATRYLFLNSHYLPQICWLINLARYLDRRCILRFHDFKDISRLLYHDDKAGIEPAGPELLNKILANDTNLSFWFFIDQILRDLAGQCMTWDELVDFYRTKHHKHFDILTSKSLELADVLRQA